MIGGSIAEIWPADECVHLSIFQATIAYTIERRGFFMALFSISAVGSVGVGACIAAYIETAPGLGWRWIQWIHCMFVFSLSGIHSYSLNINMQCGRGPHIASTRTDEGDAVRRHPHPARSQDEGGNG
jgi:MFS family permease